MGEDFLQAETTQMSFENCSVYFRGQDENEMCSEDVSEILVA